MHNKNVISASIVLYNSDINQLKRVIQSYSPSEYRLLYLIDNSPTQTDVGSIIASNNYIHYYFLGKNGGTDCFES
jgi:hypothetical protein